MFRHLLTLLGLCAVVGLQAEVVPSLTIGGRTTVALRDIGSIELSQTSLTIHLADGTDLVESLSDITFGMTELEGLSSLSADADVYCIYDLQGRLVKQGQGTTSPLVGLEPGQYVLRQQGMSRKLQLQGDVFQPYSVDVPSYATRATSAEMAMRVCYEGIDPVWPVSDVQMILFDPDLEWLKVRTDRVGASIRISDIDVISFSAFDPAVVIEYQGDDIEGVNPYFGQGVCVNCSGGHVNVINESYVDSEIEYLLSGFSADGSFRIQSEYKWQATLCGLDLTNPAGPAINGQTGKKGTIHLQKDTRNRLSDGATYEESDEDRKGCIFSEGQLIFNGQGSLQVTSLYKHAIVSDDFVSFNNGTVEVLSAASDAVHAKDSVIVQSGAITLSPLSDGIDCDGPVIIRQGENGIPQLSITTTGDGAKGIKTGADFTMTDGYVTITQTGKKKVEDGDTSRVIGIKATGNITITGGTVIINNTADGGKDISADGSITVGESALVSWR